MVAESGAHPGVEFTEVALARHERRPAVGAEREHPVHDHVVGDEVDEDLRGIVTAK
jgi:hypothetical protein